MTNTRNKSGGLLPTLVLCSIAASTMVGAVAFAAQQKQAPKVSKKVTKQAPKAGKQTPKTKAPAPRVVSAPAAVALPSPDGQFAMDKPAADFKLKDIAATAAATPAAADSAGMVQLSAFRDKKAVVLFFMSEKCSVTWRYEQRFGKLLQEYAKKDVAFLGVRCSANDTPENLLKFAEAKNFDMPLLNDDKGQMARYFGVVATPTFVVLDKKGVVRYRGSFDDNADEKLVAHALVPNAVSSVLANKEVPIKSHRVFG